MPEKAKALGNARDRACPPRAAENQCPARKGAHFRRVIHRESRRRHFELGNAMGRPEAVCSQGQPNGDSLDTGSFRTGSSGTVPQGRQKAPTSYREGAPGRETGQGENPATDPHPLSGGPRLGRLESHHQQGKENSGCRPGRLEDPGGENRNRYRVETEGLPVPAASKDLYPEEERQKSAAVDSHHVRSGDAGAPSSNPHPHCGRNGGPELVWLQTQTVHGRCPQTVPYYPVSKIIAGMDSGRRHTKLFRHDQPRVAHGQHSDGQSRPGTVAEGGICRQESPVSHRTGDPTRGNRLTNPVEHGTRWPREAP